MTSNQGPTQVWFATTNSGKLNEVKTIIAQQFPQWELHSLSELKAYTAPPETGTSFKENALIKAKNLRAVKPDAWIIAEDSGLEVESLGNLPGVHSARYAGNHARDAENIAKVLRMMQIKGASSRKARFFCSLIAFAPQSKEALEFTGEMRGEIARAPKGQLGFGYDPIFIPEGETQTLAELGPGLKNKVSHRAQALRSFLSSAKLEVGDR